MNTLSSEEEAKRLAALNSYQILDSLPEQEYEDITLLAAQICQTPVALITLVDGQRQWFKSKRGLSFSQTPRQDSFCAHNIPVSSTPLVVEDARLDQRFQHNPLVTGEPNIVFYAGEPLVDENGFTLGSLCVIDSQVRQLDSGQLAALKVLARQVSALLSTRRNTIEATQIKQQLAVSEIRFQSIVDEAPVAMLVYTGPDMVLTQANEKMLTILGRDQSIIGQPIMAAIPELVDTPLLSHYLQVLRTGETYQEQASRILLMKADQPYWGYYDYTYKALLTSDGIAYGVICSAVEVTAQVEAQLALATSEAQFRGIVEQAPMAIGQLKGRELIIEVGNERIFDVWGKDASVLGKPLVEALPELEGQPFIALLENVYDTGTPFHGTAVLAKLVRQGKLEDAYFDFSYSPIRDMDGQTTGILIMAIEVTQQVLARQEIERSEQRFRSLVTDAPFAIAIYETPDLLISLANDAIIRLWGKTKAVIGQKLIDALPELADQPFIPLLNVVYATGETYRTTEQAADLLIDGRMQTRWFSFVYQPLLDGAGQLYAILNMAVDITDTYIARQQLQQSEQSYRELAVELDDRVQARTQELLLANRDLQRSNDNLQQFAFIASHDLQEPLRKIQAFSDLLGLQLANHAEQSVGDHLQRIAKAAARMSLLVRDLLAYSRIATRQQAFGLVSLSEIMTDVLATLHRTIQRTGAQIEVAELPTARGDKTQLAQLFENLLTNAIKFVEPEQRPQIQVQYAHRSVKELPDNVRPSAIVPFYHQISVTDTGIGFDCKYLDRIFQVFQQLNSRSDYPGTGVGLAICQRVVENHGGNITADSSPGQGATFCVYLPA